MRKARLVRSILHKLFTHLHAEEQEINTPETFAAAKAIIDAFYPESSIGKVKAWKFTKTLYLEFTGVTE